MKSDIHEKRLQRPYKRELLNVEIEEDGKTRKLELEERQVCWEGYRRVSGRLIRGVPKRSKKDCMKYCRHEGCDLL